MTYSNNNVDLIAIIKITLVIYLLSRVAIWFEYSAINNLTHNNSGFIGNFWRWDSGWYQTVVEHGYATSFNGEAVNWPFFPLWPILLKIISLNGTLPIPLMGLIANQIIFFSALIVFYLYLIEIKTNHESALFAVIMLAISPANIYFCSGLTESSFLLLSLLSFYFLYRKQYIFCIVCAGLLSATRMVGAFFIIPLIYQLYFKDKVQPAKIIPYAIASVSGLILFVIYMQIHTGHPFGFLEIQSQIKDWARPGLVWDDQLFSQIYSVMTNTSHIYDREIFIFSLVLNLTAKLLLFMQIHSRKRLNFQSPGK
jgi:Gpi18-like mannosyltransferase